MKHIIQLFVIALIVFNAACKKCDVAKDVPSCVENSIRENKNNPNWQFGGVDEYEFQGKLVYAYSPSKNIADGSTSVVTDNCVSLCSVGGFGGPAINQCNGENFFQKAVFKRNIWKRD